MTRQVEVFTAGCPVCEPVVRLVEEMACPNCEIIVHDFRQTEGSFAGGSNDATEKAAHYGVRSIPAVVVDGNLLSCCQNRGPDREELAAAGIGLP